jgi:hypothetical protein
MRSTAFSSLVLSSGDMECIEGLTEINKKSCFFNMLKVSFSAGVLPVFLLF